jgi:dTDP-4-amino-4,6-dideoxygalactose transaminase
MESILKISGKYGFHVIEDTAQAVGADFIFRNSRRMKAGTIGTLGTASFFPSKNLGCYGDGGAVMTRDGDLAERVRVIVNHGSRVKYFYDETGVNSRLDTLQAAILRVKLRHLEEFNAARRKAAEAYDRLLGDVPRLRIPSRSPWSTHIFHQYTLVLEEGNRDELVRYLGSKKIPAMVYYPLPLHLQKAYRNLNYSEGDFPVTESLSKSVFSIPMHTELETEQIEYICHHIKEFLTG